MKTITLALCLAIAALFAQPAFAHTAILKCSDNGDGTVFCEGGYSDGTPAGGTFMKLSDDDGKTILSGKMDNNGEFTFDKPDVHYTVVFDGGEGHQAEVDSNDIVE
ncbi:MAG: hypothetical protein LBF41_09300 [Deltaproteobacteria bacterium]|jgi:hypothetical protein|nr:hypothetical protein [Deltaproteobacteria bacterium]